MTDYGHPITFGLSVAIIALGESIVAVGVGLRGWRSGITG
jgi:hypothetical protein